MINCAACGLAVDSSGDIYLADSTNHCIRKFSSLGSVSTIAGVCGGYFSNSNAYVSPTTGFSIGQTPVGFSIGSADGTAARFNFPQAVAVDSSKNLYIADTSNHRIRMISSSGVVTTLAGSSSGFVDDTGTRAKFNSPYALTLDNTGNIIVADRVNNRIRIITAGTVSTLAGSGSAGYADGPCTSAMFNWPQGVAFVSSGSIFVSDANNNCIRKIILPTCSVITVAGNGIAGFADGEGTNARFWNPRGLTIDSSYRLYVADQFNHRIRVISSTGVVSTIAGNGVGAYSDDIGTNAMFYSLISLAVDASGTNLFVGDNLNRRIRRVNLSSTQTFPKPFSVCNSKWHHIALTYTGLSSTNTLTAFVNGTSIGSTVINYSITPPGSSSSLRLGTNGLDANNKEFFSGSISDTRIYSRALSMNELAVISSVYVRPTVSSTPSPTISATSTATATRRQADLQSTTPSPRPFVNIAFSLGNVQLSLFTSNADQSTSISSFSIAISAASSVASGSVSIRRIRDMTDTLLPVVIWINPQFAGDVFPSRRRLQGGTLSTGSIEIDAQISVTNTDAASKLRSTLASSSSKLATDIHQSLLTQGSPLSSATISAKVEVYTSDRDISVSNGLSSGIIIAISVVAVIIVLALSFIFYKWKVSSRTAVAPYEANEKTKDTLQEKSVVKSIDSQNSTIMTSSSLSESEAISFENIFCDGCGYDFKDNKHQRFCPKCGTARH
jgi:hypothetical protein